ncbi:VWA-like domain-containing protein [Aureispira sp. CCB-QB1]|uniref:vWA domain-containing protein n=1 Tax=Aureispira sp. CCB-QB1 TaxID=1313421 RepID=UPI000697DB7B|nr:VWA-like domain-containing protein [Aureispira sp. CCB-QB1]
MSHQRILDEVAKTSIQLMLQETFYGHFFTSILKDVSERTSSIATTISSNQMIKLIVNPDYWDNTLKIPGDEEATKALRYGAIKHQILHIVFKHALRFPEFGNKKLFGIASDLAANQYIRSDQLTEDAIRMEDFPEFKLNRGQGIDYYYKRLSEELQDMQQDGGSGCGDDDEEDSAQSDDKAANGLNQAQNRLKELMENEDNEQLNQHKFWDEFERLSSAEQKMINAAINESIVNSVSRVKSKDYGKLPGGLQEYINLLVESLKPNVNWRRVLRIFTASSSRTRLKNTIRRPSKRYGTNPGIKIQSKQKILVAIDTSGSVNEDELREFFGELYHIWKQGAEIYVVECDTHIHNQYTYTGRPPELISGRGGTDFNAPIEFANEKHLPDAIVYFTDGYAPAPVVVSRKPILWMVTSQGIDKDTWDFLPGRKVKMTKQLA